MATYNWFSGFQTRWSVNSLNGRNLVHSLTKADATQTYVKIGQTTAGSLAGFSPIQAPSMGTVNNGETGVMRCRVKFRRVVSPNVDKALFYMNGGASTFQTCGVLMNSSGQLQCWTNIVNTGPFVAATASSVMPADEWVVADITVTVTNSSTVNADTLAVSCELTFEDASTETVATATSATTSLGTPQFGTFRLWDVPTSSGFTSSWSGELHFAQWIMRAATNSDVAGLGTLPPVTARIGMVKVTGDEQNQWSSETFLYFNKRVEINIAADGSRTVSTSGQKIEFTHQTLEEVAGPSATTTYGIKLVQLTTIASGSIAAQFVINGATTAATAGNVGTSISVANLPYYCDFTTRDAATFDAMTWGAESLGASILNRCEAVTAEVIYDGDATPPELFDLGGGYHQAVLAWTGNGSSPRTLTGVGFRPTGAWVFPSGGSQGTYLMVEGMSHSVEDTGTYSLTNWLGFTADGMVVGDNFNTNAQNYTAVFFRDDGREDGSGYIWRWQYGTVDGRGESYTWGTPVSMTPHAVVAYPAIQASSGSSVFKHTDGFATDESNRWSTTAGSSTGYIEELLANGVRFGTSTSVLFGTESSVPFMAWAPLAAIHEAMQFERIPDWEATGITTFTVDHNVILSFEDPTDTEIDRPTVAYLGGDRKTGGSETGSTVSITTTAAANRGLLVIAITYGLSGTRSVTFDGVTVPIVLDGSAAFHRCTIHWLPDVDDTTANLVWASTSSVNSIRIAAFQVDGTHGIRSLHAVSGVADAGNYSRGRDLILAMVGSDPLDSGSSYAETSGWTELFNDGTATAAAAAWWSTGDDTGTMMKSPTITETGTSDVLMTAFAAFIPAGIPEWDPYLVLVRGDYTTPAVTGVRQDNADFSGTSNATLSAGAVSVNNGIEAMDDYTASVVQSAGAVAQYLREAQAWYVAFATTFTDAQVPTTVDDAYTTSYLALLSESAPGILANDLTNDGGTMTAVLDTDVTNGTLTLNADGSFDYTPDPGFIGEDSFTYHAVNDVGDGNIATVTITVSAPEGGGAVVPGTNPAPFVQPDGVLRVFVEFKLRSGTHFAIAETTLRDPLSWYGGKKLPALISLSEIERELTNDGSFRGVEVRVTAADDGTFRTLAAEETIANAYAAVYVVSDETRYALGVPTRLIAGVVAKHGALPGHRYEFVIRDVLSDKIARLDTSPKVPPDRLSVTQFPGMEAQYEGRAAPLVLGLLADSLESGNFDTDPQGVVPPVVLGKVNLSIFGGPNVEALAAMWSLGACAAIGSWQVYYNPPNTPDVRIPVDPSAWGTIVWTPGMPGWLTPPYYIDWPTGPTAETRRYTPFFVDDTTTISGSPGGTYADAVREGRVLIAANIFGLEENGDGTGLYFNDAPRIWQWLIVNQLFVPYRYGAYAAIPTFPAPSGTYSIIDTDTVEAVTTYLRSRMDPSVGYPVGFILGRGGTQQTLRHVLGELCQGVLMEQGINRHGQLMLSVENTGAAADIELSDLLDIEDGSFETWIDRDAWFDRIEYTYGFRYVPPSAPHGTPPEGEALPAQPVSPYIDWTSGLQSIQSTEAITANDDEVRTFTFENYVVRATAIADDVAQRLLDRSVGPAPAYDGPRMFRLTTSWQGLAVELGTVIGITHVEGYGPTGYEGQRGRVLKIQIDPQRARVTLEGRILGASAEDLWILDSSTLGENTILG